LKVGIYNKKNNIFFILLKDLSIFCDKKTNFGLFNLENSLNLHLFFKGGDFYSSKLILRNLKLKNLKF
jgi:hypothetical protein